MPTLVPSAGVDYMSTASLLGATKSERLRVVTRRIYSQSDLRLKAGEVLLTFDDGPSVTQTPRILKALAQYGVRATFFMVGKSAKAHPGLVQQVARAGHTIGSHTHNHENLAKRSQASAVKAVLTGEDEVAAALAPIGKKVAPFFRFPYLAQTRALRANLQDSGLVIFDVDVDSADYKKDSSAAVLARVLARLDAAKGGIVLFHDIHGRTARMLPDFLAALKERGYKIVHAVPGNGRATLLADLNLRLSAEN